EAEESKVIEAKAETLKGLKVVGRIDLPEKKVKKEDGPVASSDDAKDKKKKKRPRKRIRREQEGSPRSQADDNRDASKRKPGFSSRARVKKEELTDKEIQEQIKATLAKLSGGKGSGSNRSKY